MTDLRDYQAAAVEKLEAATKALFVAPTGSGKTIIATSIIERAVERGERVLMLTHRREILRQTSLKLPIDHGLIQAGLNIDLSYPVQVASVQTLARCMRTDKCPLPAANLIIIDEAHHVAATTWRKILEAYPNARKIGLTATPCRSDGRGLGNYFDELILGPQIPELIAQKHLVPTVYYAPAEPDLKGVETRQGDYAIGQLADRMNRDDLVGDIISAIGTSTANAERRWCSAVDVAHSVHVRDEFIKSGVRAEHVDGSTPKTERDAILARLASGETELVTNCMVLTEGFDLPAIGCIVLARPTKQLGLFRQMAGRGLRPAPGKTNLILIDHSGAVYRHGLLEDEIEWTLDVTKRADNPTHQKRDKQTTSRLIDCSQCGALRTGGEACPHCGFLPKRRPEAIIFADGELARVDRNGNPIASSDPHEKMKWLAMLYFIERQKGYRQGWARVNFRKKFGGYPPYGCPMPPTEPTPEVSAWVRSQMIAYAKARQKAKAA